MQIGYCRVSTVAQAAGFEAQQRQLDFCDKVFEERVSAVGARDQLNAAIDYLRDGDTLVVTKLDRLARSTRHLGEVVETVSAKGAYLRVMDLGIDTGSATGELIVTVIGAIAQFERQMMLERQREGIAKAKSEGKYKGRAPTARAKTNEVLALRASGMGATAIAGKLSISRASVYRILKSELSPELSSVHGKGEVIGRDNQASG